MTAAVVDLAVVGEAGTIRLLRIRKTQGVMMTMTTKRVVLMKMMMRIVGVCAKRVGGLPFVQAGSGLFLAKAAAVSAAAVRRLEVLEAEVARRR